MSNSSASARELVDKVLRNEIRLPEMQRGYVWKSTQVRDLIDSLYRGYPAGNILMRVEVDLGGEPSADPRLLYGAENRRCNGEGSCFCR